MKDAKKFIERVEAFAREWDVSAVVSMRDQDGLNYDKAFGYADRAQDRAMTLEERFCVDAENNFFMTLCVLHLMEAKKLRLNDPISRCLPEYKHGERITIQHLLRWESGIQDYWSHVRMPELQKDPAHAALSDQEKFVKEYLLYAQETTYQEALQMIGEDELTHDPGKEDDGSETTIVFLAEIIRRVSGMAPREYLMRHFFGPLGMRDTLPGNEATVALQGVMNDTVMVPLPKISPRYAITTTAQDMNILARALVEKRLFSEKTIDLMLRCKRESSALGFLKRSETLYSADFYPMPLRDTCQLYLNFAEGISILILNSEEYRCKLDNSRVWHTFPSDVRQALYELQAYPKNPELKRVGAKNVWDATSINIHPEQLAFVPDCCKCIAYSLARRQPAYVLMDHGLPIGMAALTIDKKKKEYHISFLQVDKRYQGRGYGRILLTKAMEILKEKGATSLEIGVNRYNIPAQRLYRSVGFREDQVYEGFIELKMTL